MSPPEFSTLWRIFQLPNRNFTAISTGSSFFPQSSLSQPLSLRSNCLGSLKSTFHLLLAHLLPTKGAWPWQHLEKLCEKCWPIQKGEKRKYIKEKIPPEVPHLLHSLGTLKLTHKFSSGWPTACGWLSTRYF